MNIYRKIYEEHFGAIPKDEHGRTFEIHHIDGNRNNNVIENLICVSIEEHYNIHYIQGDWAACLLMADRMKIDPKEKSLLAKKHAINQIETNTHPWKTEEYRIKQKNRALLNSNPFIGGEIQRKSNQKRLKDKTHHFLGSNINKLMLDNGSHPSQKPWVCPVCNKSGKNSTNYKRFHGESCNKKG